MRGIYPPHGFAGEGRVGQSDLPNNNRRETRNRSRPALPPQSQTAKPGEGGRGFDACFINLLESVGAYNVSRSHTLL